MSKQQKFLIETNEPFHNNSKFKKAMEEAQTYINIPQSRYLTNVFNLRLLSKEILTSLNFLCSNQDKILDPSAYHKEQVDVFYIPEFIKDYLLTELKYNGSFHSYLLIKKRQFDIETLDDQHFEIDFKVKLNKTKNQTFLFIIPFAYGLTKTRKHIYFDLNDFIYIIPISTKQEEKYTDHLMLSSIYLLNLLRTKIKYRDERTFQIIQSVFEQIWNKYQAFLNDHENITTHISVNLHDLYSGKVISIKYDLTTISNSFSISTSDFSIEEYIKSLMDKRPMFGLIKLNHRNDPFIKHTYPYGYLIYNKFILNLNSQIHSILKDSFKRHTDLSVTFEFLEYNFEHIMLTQIIKTYSVLKTFYSKNPLYEQLLEWLEFYITHPEEVKHLLTFTPYVYNSNTSLIILSLLKLT